MTPRKLISKSFKKKLFKLIGDFIFESESDRIQRLYLLLSSVAFMHQFLILFQDE